MSPDNAKANEVAKYFLDELRLDDVALKYVIDIRVNADRDAVEVTYASSDKIEVIGFAEWATGARSRDRSENNFRSGSDAQARVAEASSKMLEIAPGFALHKWLSSFCPRTFTENVLDELLSTGTLMYQEALARGDVSAARNVRWAMRFWMLKAVLGGFVTGAFLLLAQFRRKSE